MWRARRGGPRTLSRTDANLDCAFFENENTLVFVAPKIGGRALGPPLTHW